MRILTYLLLLLLLGFTAVTVYILTQDGSYKVTYSHLIKSPRITIFDYVNDLKNWETFNAWKKEDATMNVDYPAKTSGLGASFSWIGESQGRVKTTYVKVNDSLSHHFLIDGISHKLQWKFKETSQGTLVTCTMNGKAGLMEKVTTFFKGGISRVIQNKLAKSVIALDKTLDYEMKTYSVKINGLSSIPAQYFIKQTFTCKVKSIQRNIKIILPRLIYFFKKNKLNMAGKPFVIYERYEPSKDFATLSVCVPTEQLIYVDAESDISTGQSEPFTCIKSTLTGDYSHLKETWLKTEKYIVDNNFKHNFAGKYIEVYSRTIDDIKNPSKWTTELYIPVFPKEIKPSATAVNVELSQTTTETNTQNVPQPEVQETE